MIEKPKVVLENITKKYRLYEKKSHWVVDALFPLQKKNATDFVELGRFIKQPLKTYSKGMASRLSFAVKMFIDPDILLVDEALSGGDEYFKSKSIDKMKELFKSGKTIFYVSHSPKDISELCTRAILLRDGKMYADGNPDEIMKEYRAQIKASRKI